METSKPLVTVVVLAYNHEKYIEQCLMSLAAQKTTFPFEVLVGEDASKDGTADILRALEPKLPSYFTIICREKNLNAGNAADLLLRGTGKYLAICEGDDYWTYEYKLQEQVDFLENNPDYVACFHDCEVVDENSHPTGNIYPSCNDDEYTLNHFYYSILPGQSASFVALKKVFEDEKAIYHSHQHFKSYPGDRRNAFILASVGKIKVFHHKWSAYRYVTQSGTSYSATVKINKQYAENEVGFGETIIDYAKEKDNPEALDIAKAVYYRILLKWSVGKVKVGTLREAFGQLFKEKAALRYLFKAFSWYVVLTLRTIRFRGKLL